MGGGLKSFFPVESPRYYEAAGDENGREDAGERGVGKKALPSGVGRTVTVLSDHQDSYVHRRRPRQCVPKIASNTHEVVEASYTLILRL